MQPYKSNLEPPQPNQQQEADEILPDSNDDGVDPVIDVEEL